MCMWCVCVCWTCVMWVGGGGWEVCVAGGSCWVPLGHLGPWVPAHKWMLEGSREAMSVDLQQCEHKSSGRRGRKA
jgi:hypothetical protein